MQMTFKLKALAVAVSLGLGLSAQAAQINADNIANVGFGSGTGSLVLAMFDAANGKSLVFNTGLNATSFNAQANTSFSVSIAAADQTKLNTFLGGVSNFTQFKWNLAAIDNRINDINGLSGGPFFDPFGFQTTLKPGTTLVANVDGPNSAAPGIASALGKMGVFYGAQNAFTGNPLATGNVVVTTNATSPSFFTQNYGSNLGNSGGFDNTGAINNSLEYYFYHGLGVSPDLNQTKVDKYAGKWTLGFTPGQNVTFSYGVQAVPIPAALWLFATGLTGLATIRRRNAS